MKGYSFFSRIRHLYSPLHLPRLSKGQLMRTILSFLKRALTGISKLLPSSLSKKQANVFSNQTGLAPKYLFIKNPHAKPDKNIKETAKKIDAAVKPLFIKALSRASKISNIKNPLRNYIKKGQK